MSDRFLMPDRQFIKLPKGWLFKKRDIPPLLRKVHCICGQVLAAEAGYPNQTAVEFISIGVLGVWKSGKWWGNKTVCPICGLHHTLPMDKPLVCDEDGKLPDQTLKPGTKIPVLKAR